MQLEYVQVKKAEVLLFNLKIRYQVGDETYRRFLAENLETIPCLTKSIQ
jgi:hypothetical protein